MRARITVQEREFQGTVDSVATQPEASSWFSGNVKEYATIVKIDGEPENLKPGMTAEVEILVEHLEDVVALPVAAVVEQRGNYYCWVKKGGSVERTKLDLGPTNDKFVQVKDGVSEGDQVVLNPRSLIEEAKGGEVEAEEEDVDAKFGRGAGRGPGAGRGGRGGPGAARGW